MHCLLDVFIQYYQEVLLWQRDARVGLQLHRGINRCNLLQIGRNRFDVTKIMSLLAKCRYYTPNEVCVHNTVDDLWVSFLGRVFDLTPLCTKYKGLSLLLRTSVQILERYVC